MKSVLLFQPWGWMSSQTWISLATISWALLMLHEGSHTASPVLSVVFTVSATYSLALLQGLKLGPFVLTNVTTCKLFLAQKSSLRDLIFGLVSPTRAHTRAGGRTHPHTHHHRPPGASPWWPSLTLASLTKVSEDKEVIDRLMGWAEE